MYRANRRIQTGSKEKGIFEYRLLGPVGIRNSKISYVLLLLKFKIS